MNLRIQQLLKLHKLFKPMGDDGADTGGTDVLDEVDDDQGDDAAADGGSDGDGTNADADEEAEGEVDDVVITIGNEQPAEEAEDQARAPEWVRDLRKSNREKDRVIRELQAKVAQATPAPVAVVLGVKPTLSGCDFDEDKFEADLTAWHERKRQADDQQRTQAQTEQKSREAWQAKLSDYGKAKTSLKVADFDDAEDSAREIFSVTQQGVILSGAENAAVLIYALGKNPKKAKELATLTDPVKFAFAVAKLETQLKVTPRKTPPPPERTLRGGSTSPVIANAALDALKKQAEQTGDYTKYFAAKRAKK